MTDITIRLAEDDGDIEAARSLCRDWLAWHWENAPAGWPTDGNPMNRDTYQAVLDALPTLHARPRGGIVIASVNGQPAGCVMFNQASPDTAEFNRMFVRDTGRGHGLGRAILDFMFKQMAADGYTRVFFSSATFLTHARAMYESAGFRPMPTPDDFPDAWRDKVYFMDRSIR